MYLKGTIRIVDVYDVIIDLYEHDESFHSSGLMYLASLMLVKILLRLDKVARLAQWQAQTRIRSLDAIGNQG